MKRKGKIHHRREIWLALAELFFLDTEPTDEDYARVATLLRKYGWDRNTTKMILIQSIAPHAGHNLGFLVWPAIGAWSGFDATVLGDRIRRSVALRRLLPDWRFILSDWWCQRMLTQLGIEKLLSLL